MLVIKLLLLLQHQTKTNKIMKATEKEFQKNLQRVIDLKNNLFGVNNWKKSYLPKDNESCLAYIKYCKHEYGIIA